MAYNTYRSTSASLQYDAFYSDEFGVVNDSRNTTPGNDQSRRLGFRKNRFTQVSPSTTNPEFSLYWTQSLENMANPSFNIALKAKQGGTPQNIAQDTHRVKFFFSESVRSLWLSIKDDKSKPWKQPINLSILYAVDTELNRHGIRSWFEKKTSYQAIIVVPGIEPRKKGDSRWGVAIGTDQIKKMLRTVFERDVPFNVMVLAAFSTGINGLNQTLLNELVPLSDVDRLVIYDCLYEQSSGSTAEAIKVLKRKASSTLKIVVYKTSEGEANSLMPDNRLSVPTNNPGLIDSKGIIENLFQKYQYISLVCFRSLEAAAKDNVITIPKDMEAAYAAMEKIVPPRGTMISNKVCYKHVHGSLPTAGVTFYEDWIVQNEKVIKAFWGKVGSTLLVNSVRDLIWNNKLPGWRGGDGAEKHDLLIPEFGWEYLPY